MGCAAVNSRGRRAGGGCVCTALAATAALAASGTGAAGGLAIAALKMTALAAIKCALALSNALSPPTTLDYRFAMTD